MHGSAQCAGIWRCGHPSQHKSAAPQAGNYVEYKTDEVEDAWADELASEATPPAQQAAACCCLQLPASRAGLRKQRLSPPHRTLLPLLHAMRTPPPHPPADVEVDEQWLARVMAGPGRQAAEALAAGEEPAMGADQVAAQKRR